MEQRIKEAVEQYGYRIEDTVYKVRKIGAWSITIRAWRGNDAAYIMVSSDKRGNIETWVHVLGGDKPLEQALQELAEHEQQRREK